MSLIRHRPERGTKPPGAIAGPPPAAESCPSLRVSFEYRPGQGEDGNAPAARGYRAVRCL